eukprot:gene4240-4542_t
MFRYLSQRSTVNVPVVGLRFNSTIKPPRLFDYATIRKNLKPSKKSIDAVEAAFGMLAKNLVDVPIPMHIGIHETATAGPGDCHIKGGYIEGSVTWTVKLANVSFYKNVQKGLPPGSGIFIVCDATNGLPLAVFQENRYMTDLRTGAAGAVAVRHFAAKHHTKVAFIGTGAIATAMADNAHIVHPFKEAYVFGLGDQQNKQFKDHLEKNLGWKTTITSTAEEAVSSADVIFTQTPANKQVLEYKWLKPHATIIASGSDQATKNELPAEVMAKSKFVCDLVRQCSKVGELRTGLQSGLMKESDVYAELGEVVNGTKKGREGNELVVVDLTGTGAQDAAIGQIGWEILRDL